jgi:hypothetical protein
MSLSEIPDTIFYSRIQDATVKQLEQILRKPIPAPQNWLEHIVIDEIEESKESQ